jgi:hypothetical protein
MADRGRHPAKRRLCPDGRCIGLVGADDHCRECGRLFPRPPDWPEERVPFERSMCGDAACFGITQLASTGPPYRPVVVRECPLCGRRAPA